MKKFLKFSFSVLTIVVSCAVMVCTVCANGISLHYIKNEGESILDNADLSKLVESIGTSPADWFLLAANRMEISSDGTKDELESAIIETYNSGGYKKATDGQRIAILLSALKGNPQDVLGDGKINILADVVYMNPKVKNGGINALSYGLIALDTNDFVLPDNAIVSREDIINSILNLQLKDSGGFTLAGNNPDPDITAIVITALAPYYQKDRRVAKAIELALDYLSEVQTDNGGFKSYGIECCESVSQVIIALTSLGIDITGDKRFVKNGNTPIEALMQFKVSGGTYSHTLGGKENNIATGQAFLAFSAYYRYLSGLSPLFLFNKNAPAVYSKIESEIGEKISSTITPSSSNTTVISSDDGLTTDVNSSVNNTTSELPINKDIFDLSSNTDAINNELDGNIGVTLKLMIVVILSLVVLCLLTIVFLLKRKGYRLISKPCSTIVIIAIILSILVVVVSTLNFESVDQYYNASNGQNQRIGSVTVSIDCCVLNNKPETVPDNLKKFIPVDGYILKPTTVFIYENDTVFSLLKRVAKENKIHLEFNNISSAYVEGIGYLYEFSCGDLSGWIYCVNGKKAEISGSDYLLNNGDVVEWRYTLALGNDISEQ